MTRLFMKYLKYFGIVILAITMLSGCATQNPYAKKRKKSHVTTSALGRNRYYFSKDYQKKLKKSYRQKRY